MRIALAQLNSTTSPEQNLQLVRSWSQRAGDVGAELVVFPEATMCRFGHPLDELAQPVNGPWANTVRDIAKEYGVHVAVGMFTPADGGRVTNTLLLTGPDADATYDKIHLYDAFGYRESDSVAPGTNPVVVEVAGVKVGLTTCYDVRFPGLFTELARAGAEVVLVCASWGSGPGKVEQWKLLTRARALDATVFVAACGQADPSSATEVAQGSGAPLGVGHSAVISPWGAELVAAGGEAELLVVDLDLDEVSKARAAIPVLENAGY